MGWTHKYDADDYPYLIEGWYLVTGFFADMEIYTDPDDPTNNLLQITSYDGPDVDEDDAVERADGRNRPQVRLDYYWEADPAIGSTFEMRFKQSAGGVFGQAMDGTHQFSFESKDVDGLGIDQIWILWPASDIGNVLGPLADFTDWQVMRCTWGMNEDETYNVMVYMNGEEMIRVENANPEVTGRNVLRIGHSGGSGPPDQAPADIWLDYLYVDNTGQYAPGEPTWGETAVEASSWGSIKALF